MDALLRHELNGTALSERFPFFVIAVTKIKKPHSQEFVSILNSTYASVNFRDYPPWVSMHRART